MILAIRNFAIANLVLFVLVSNPILAQKKAKVETNVGVSNFQTFKGQIPEPFLEGNPKFVKLYYAAWEKYYNQEKDSTWLAKVTPLYKQYSIPVLKYAAHTAMAKPFVTIPDEKTKGILLLEDSAINQLGTLPWLEWDYFQISGDESRLSKQLKSLEFYGNNVFSLNQKRGNKHSLFSGVNIPSYPNTYRTLGSGWVGLSAQMAMYYNYLAKIEEALHQQVAVIDTTKERAKNLNNQINSYCWNSTKGFYYDVDDEGSQNKFKTIEAGWVLLAKTGNAAQRKGMVNSLTSKGEFNRIVPFSHTSINERIWQLKYPNNTITNPITTYGLLHGFVQAGVTTKATDLCVKSLSVINANFEKTKVLCGDMPADTVVCASPPLPSYVSNAELLPIAGLIEIVLGIRVTEKGIFWDVNRTDRHGLNNLTIAGKVYSFESKYRLMPNDEGSFTIVAADVMRLTITVGNRSKSMILKKGVNRFVI